jgi:hypothetical protein
MVLLGSNPRSFSGASPENPVDTATARLRLKKEPGAQSHSVSIADVNVGKQLPSFHLHARLALLVTKVPKHPYRAELKS